MRQRTQRLIVGCIAGAIVTAVLWWLILASVMYLAGCSVSVESGIHDSLHADQELHTPTPEPTPTAGVK